MTAASSSDTARVAYFDFNEESVYDVNLFASAYENRNSHATTVASSNDDKIVAPGTYCSVDLELIGSAEVNTTVTFAFAETNTGNIPIVYQYNGLYYSSTLSMGVYYLKQDGRNSSSLIAIAGNLNALYCGQ